VANLIFILRPFWLGPIWLEIKYIHLYWKVLS